MSTASRERGIALGGMMGAGKTTVGAALAARLGVPFVDVDRALEERHGPIAAQFEEAGEAGFRARERAFLEGLGPGPRVVATGGGAFVAPENRLLLRQHHDLVTLAIGAAVARRRIGSGAGRPLAHLDLEELLRIREAGYADVDLAVDGERDVESVVDDIVRWYHDVPDTASVDVAGARHDVRVREGLLGLGAGLVGVGLRRVLVISDENVLASWGDAVRRALLPVEVLGVLAIPPGEGSKSLAVYADLMQRALDAGLDRRCGIVAFGGGVVGDLAGFVAATALRGVPWVQVPTTTLAMVDSAVGGKVGINLERAKNMVGAFHQPRLVWAAMETLSSLPPREWRAGWAEAAKTAWIEGPEAWRDFQHVVPDLRAHRLDAARAVVGRCLRFKAAVVARDEREAGERIALNLGHTVGHAVEAGLGYGVLLHGEAVAIGLVAEARLAERLGICRGAAEDLAAVLTGLGFVLRPPSVDREAALRALQVDKKRQGAMFQVPLPVRPGEVRVASLTLADIASAVPGVR